MSLWPERARDRHAVVPVLHEVQLADPVDVDRRHRLALALGQVDALPALADPRRGGAEVAVELARAVDGPDDRVELDQLLAEPPLADAAERADDLLEREDVVHVVGPAQARGQAREGAPAARAAEVVLSVGARKPGVPGHGPRVLREGAARSAPCGGIRRRVGGTDRHTHAHAAPGPQGAPGRARNGHREMMLDPRGAGSRAAARRVCSPTVALAPTRQSWSGQRTLTTILPAASGCWRAAIRAIRGGGVTSSSHGCARTCPRRAGGPPRGGAGSPSGSGERAARRRRSTPRSRPGRRPDRAAPRATRRWRTDEAVSMNHFTWSSGSRGKPR